MVKKVKSQKLKVKSYQGFTLIELLVVVSLIGILATLLFANLNAARERGRDAQRKADLRNIQTALRLYFNDNGGYPIADGSYQIVGCGLKTARTTCAWGTSWTTSEGQVYMNVLPKDPLDQPNNSINDYRYISTGGDDYTIRACLENKSDTQGRAATGTETSWCTSGWVYEVKS